MEKLTLTEEEMKGVVSYVTQHPTETRFTAFKDNCLPLAWEKDVRWTDIYDYIMENWEKSEYHLKKVEADKPFSDLNEKSVFSERPCEKSEKIYEDLTTFKDYHIQVKKITKEFYPTTALWVDSRGFNRFCLVEIAKSAKIKFKVLKEKTLFKAFSRDGKLLKTNFTGNFEESYFNFDDDFYGFASNRGRDNS
jgi:hypothetical protein